MTRFVIAVVNRGTYGQSSADLITISCENSRTDTTNGINITTTNVQNGQPYGENGQTFKYIPSLPLPNRVIIYSTESFLLINISKDMVDSF
jgi:hypothetical protein